jgi:PAS domain S-box-containing protein
MTVTVVLLLWLTHPLTWSNQGALWAPSAGLGLAVVAWLGIGRSIPLLLSAALLVVVQVGVRLFLTTPSTGAALGLASLLLTALDVLLGAAEAPVAWWLYHDQARGSRRLSDPRSATAFLMLVPGLVVAGFALARTVLQGLGSSVDTHLHSPWTALVLVFLRCWLDRALGMLIVAPPLLVNVTPWLLRHRLILPEPWIGPARAGERSVASPEGPPVATATRWGDWIEVTGLAVGASVLCLWLTHIHNRRELLGWQLWGVQLLLILWASMRQGLRGGTLVAAVAAALPLLVLPQPGIRLEDPFFPMLLQGHLLAQCGAALLIAAGASWVRISETGYRRVVAHIPVVIYSARLRRDLTVVRTGGGNGPLERGESSGLGVAEVTLVSAASIQLLNCAPELLLGDYSRWLACVHADDREVLLAALVQLARQDHPVTCEYRVASGESSSSRRARSDHASNGSSRQPIAPPAPQVRMRWVRDTLAPTRDHEGRLIGWEGVVTDITEQRTLADDLRRTTSMFHALVANLPTGVFFVQGPHGQPILVNARARQLLGQREDAAAGLDHLSRVYRLHRPDGTLYPVEELPVYLALRAGRTTMRDDIVVHRPDGRRIPLVTWAAPVLLGGRANGADAAVWVMEDLTALHQAEAARQDSESRLRAVIETMAEGLIVQNRRGVIADCNPSACVFLGLSADQLRGRALSDLDWTFIREDGAEVPSEEVPSQVVLRTGRPVRNAVLGIRLGREGSSSGSGLVRWVLVNAVPLGLGRLGNGSEESTPPAERHPAGVVTTFSDISAYVQAREAIRASEERYRGLVETLPMMLLLSDRDLRVTYMNPAYRAATGLDMEDMREPEAWARFVHPEDLPRVLELAHLTLSGQSGRLECRLRIKDGSERIIFAMTQPRWSQEGAVVGVISLMLDVTRERQLERDLQRSQRLEVMGQLAGGIAHDFNNLLSVILSLTDLARARLAEDHSAYADLVGIAEAGEQAVGLAGQLLAFSRNRRVVTRRTNLHGVLRRTLELLRSTQPARLRLDAVLAPEDLHVQADETQLQQVMMNLCLNARDAMPEGGVLGVQTALVEAERAYVVLSIIDNGCGISAEVRARIFDPFFTTKDGGTGLGLAVVKQIVEGAGGRIELSSEVGRGSRFDVWWPADLSGAAD